MPDMPIPLKPLNERCCGNCYHHKLMNLDDLFFEWAGPWVCKSPEKNPDKKDGPDGPLKYDHKACKFWK